MTPENEIPGTWSFRQFIFDSQDAAAVIVGGMRYSTGFILQVMLIREQGVGRADAGLAWSDIDPGEFQLRAAYTAPGRPPWDADICFAGSFGSDKSSLMHIWVGPFPEKEWSVQLIASWMYAGFSEVTVDLEVPPHVAELPRHQGLTGLNH